MPKLSRWHTCGEAELTARCYRHPGRETEVSCGRCGRPLCADCVQHGPTGVRCAECLRPTRRAMGLATHAQVLRAIGFSLVVAVASGALLGWSRWLGLWGSAILGLAIGSAALAGSGRHRDRSIQVVAGFMSAVGIVAAASVVALTSPAHLGLRQIPVILASAGFVVPMVVAIIAAVARFRF